jgi:SPX domain protein involved in polyphosphate accumulation
VRFIFVRGILFAAAQEMQRRQKLKIALNGKMTQAEIEATEKSESALENMKKRNEKRLLTESNKQHNFMHVLEYQLEKIHTRVEQLLTPVSEKLDRMQQQIDALQKPAMQTHQSTLSVVSPQQISQQIEILAETPSPAMHVAASELDRSSTNTLCTSSAA